MGSMPKKMVAGMAAGLIGGVASIAFMANAWDGTVESAASLGLAMLLAVLFFGVAGTFTKYSPVKGDTIVVLSALCVGFTIVAVLLEAIQVWMAFPLIILGVVAVLCGACPQVTGWVDINRKS